MAKKRGKTKVFDFGGTIKELKQRCKAETGLPPPMQPEFPRWAKVGDKKSKAASANGGKSRKVA
jgi:hypothetical protein